jgi:hypothetical protein
VERPLARALVIDCHDPEDNESYLVVRDGRLRR